MKLKGLNFFYRVYSRMLYIMTAAFALLVLLLLFLLFLLLRMSLFDIVNISDSTGLIIACCVISVLIVSQFVTVLWIRAVSRPAAEISAAAARVAEGDFTVQIDTSGFKNEMHDLGESLNKMIKELDSIEVMRTDFVSNVSHEFRAPLSSIQGCVTLLSSPGLEEGQRQEYFTLLKEATGQLSSLVDNVLTLSRLETQNFTAKSERFSLDEQLRRALLLFERDWSEKKLELELELPECEYTGQEKLLSQVWINLIGNAVKFTGEGGRIGVKLDDAEGAFVTVTVYDTGIGMTEEVRKHVFEKFYQGDSSRRGSGNGLGLALVKSICQITRCEISVDSEPGRGSAFTVRLPR